MIEIELAPMIERHRQWMMQLADQSALLAEIAQIPALPDSGESAWDGEESWEALARVLAAADVVGRRGWRDAVGPLYELAALGEVDDRMQGIRHGPEQAFAGDLSGFAAVLIPLTTHLRPGTRQWSVRELGILRRLESLDALVSALDDAVELVCAEARSSIEMLAQEHEAAKDALRG